MDSMTHTVEMTEPYGDRVSGSVFKLCHSVFVFLYRPASPVYYSVIYQQQSARSLAQRCPGNLSREKHGTEVFPSVIFIT